MGEIEKRINSNRLDGRVLVRNSSDAEEKCFETINEALEKVEKGSYIFVSPGKYDEAIEITTDYLTVHGPNFGIPGYEHDRGKEAVIDRYLEICPDAVGVTISGFKMLCKTSLYGDNLRFSDNVIESDGDGIKTRHSSSTTMSSFVIEENKITADKRGVFFDLDERSDSVEFIKNLVKGGIFGIRTKSKDNKNRILNIYGNLILKNKKGMSLELLKGDTVIKNNTIYDNKGVGVEINFNSFSFVDMKFNNIESNGAHGVLLKNGPSEGNIKIRRNNFLENGDRSLKSSSCKIIDATNNYWGEKSPDFGEKIYGEVDYVPWLREKVEEAGAQIDL